MALRYGIILLLLPAIAFAENVPQGCYRSTDNLWACYTPSDGAVNFPDKGSAVANSIQYGTAIGALVTNCSSWIQYGSYCYGELLNYETTVTRVRKKLRKAKLLANRRCS